MPCTPTQAAAISEARQLLDDAGLSSLAEKLLAHDIHLSEDLAVPNSNLNLPKPSKSASESLSHDYDIFYDPPKAQIFTQAEVAEGADQYTRQSFVDAKITHPINTMVEYPQTGDEEEQAIAHIFELSPDAAPFLDSKLDRPALAFQYSLGGKIEGGVSNQYTNYLTTELSIPPTKVPCFRKVTSCKGIKSCSFAVGLEQSHSFVTRFQGQPHSITPTALYNESPHYNSEGTSSELSVPVNAAEKEVFENTFSFWSAIIEKGCSSASPSLDTSTESGEDFRVTLSTRILASLQPGQRLRPSSNTITEPHITCLGALHLEVTKYNQLRIRCRHWSQHDRDHLFLQRLDSFDTSYLQALFENDVQLIQDIEKRAKSYGYGPLAPCSFVASVTQQKSHCPFWHRDLESGCLQRGVLSSRRSNAADSTQSQCPAKFITFTPNDRIACPKILVICISPHNHPPPLPITTPPLVRSILQSLLKSIDWRLADTTPRTLMLDVGFMKGLREVLRWDDSNSINPCLTDLHPSLGNLDHLRRIIKDMQMEFYPAGTGSAGVARLMDKQQTRPQNEQYIRCVETLTLQDGTSFHVIICMFPAMSSFLSEARWLSIDASFKRIHGKFQEFEVETWSVKHMRSIVVCRAIVTSLSTEAHKILFSRMFEIMKMDTGVPVRFRHIHGSGFEIWVADAHKGQALGLGNFCVELCRGLNTYDQFERHRLLRDLDAYDHLRRIFKGCQTHFRRNVYDLHMAKEVQDAMLSLSSSRPLLHDPHLTQTFNVIRSGGRKAQSTIFLPSPNQYLPLSISQISAMPDWLKDKVEGSKFVLPSIYQPYSLIPLDIWKASPSTTNGNEQAHRNIYRDGVDLTLLAAVMHGMQYDHRAITSLELHATVGIANRDQPSSHLHRITRSIARETSTSKKRKFGKLE